MLCFSPFIKDGKAFPCGQCFNCRSQRVREWAMRCEKELEYWPSARFVTLTYDDEHLPKDFSLHARHLELFWKNLRKRVPDFKYFACGEYGGRKKRPHYHAIIFGVDVYNRMDVFESWKRCDVRRFLYGKCYEPVDTKCIDYVVGYIRDKLTGKAAEKEYEFLEPPFQRCSKGLGRRYFIDHKDEILRQGGVKYRGKICSVPRFIVRDWREEDMAITKGFIENLDRVSERSNELLSRELMAKTSLTNLHVLDRFPCDAYHDRAVAMQEIRKSFERSYPNKRNKQEF